MLLDSWNYLLLSIVIYYFFFPKFTLSFEYLYSCLYSLSFISFKSTNKAVKYLPILFQMLKCEVINQFFKLFLCLQAFPPVSPYPSPVSANYTVNPMRHVLLKLPSFFSVFESCNLNAMYSLFFLFILYAGKWKLIFQNLSNEGW